MSTYQAQQPRRTFSIPQKSYINHMLLSEPTILSDKIRIDGISFTCSQRHSPSVVKGDWVQKMTRVRAKCSFTVVANRPEVKDGCPVVVDVCAITRTQYAYRHLRESGCSDVLVERSNRSLFNSLFPMHVGNSGNAPQYSLE